MGTVTIENPDAHKTNAQVDKQGRVYLGSEFTGKSVDVVVEVQNDE